ncbi:hypothetical protein HC891_03220 [Candidatus Gracilibacteria bacterium]|nr:hypothetical protein [Candidatus Gracilibacteria bacterium]
MSDHASQAGASEPGYTARLTRCAGTWLELPPDETEQKRILDAAREVKSQRVIALEFYRDPIATNTFSIELFRQPEFAPLHFSDELVAKILEKVGEPPVVAEEDSLEFSAYLRDAVLAVALPNPRRALAGQLRRLLPQFVAAKQWREAVAIDYNAFRTALGHEVSPFLAQMALAGLAHWYEEHDEE